jgi:Membrane proteins related to metalloendopeptidases
MKLFGGKVNRKSASMRRLASRLAGVGRILLLAAVCLAVLMASGKLSFALAVNLDGDLLGYVHDREALDTMVSRLETTVSDALGRSWSPDVTTYVTLSDPEQKLADQELAERVLAAVPELGELQVVYVDGEAVCAYEDGAEASAALEALAAAYPAGENGKVGFAQEVVVAAGTVDVALKQEADRRLAEAVTVETRNNVTVTKTIPCETREVRDSRLYTDESYVQTPGEEGFDTVEYVEVFRNGELEERLELRRIHQEPVTEVQVVGTREHHSTGTYIWPVEDGWLSSFFGPRTGIGSSDHKGVDIANNSGTPVLASDGGVVLFADEYGGYGLLIKIQHENGDVTYYAHESYILVNEGDVVEQGEVIGLMGCTGVASGNHCHFEFHPGGGEAANPMNYLPEMPYPILGNG